MKNVCLDIGGTTIKCAVVDGGNIVKYDKVQTHAKEGRDAIIASIFKAIEIMLPYADSDGGIGIGSAGDIDCEKGRVIFATGNLPNFTGLELASIVSEKFHRKTTLVNDAWAGALAEYSYGAGKDTRSMVMITLGTGVGGAYIEGGKLAQGDNFRAMRLGHITLYPGGRNCNCGKVGCVEQYVSATGFIKTAHEYGIANNESNEIFNLALDGNAAAMRAVDKFIDDLVVFVNELIAIFDPTCVIIGGGLAEIKCWWNKFLTKVNTQEAKVLQAKLGNSAGVIGANVFLTQN